MERVAMMQPVPAGWFGAAPMTTLPYSLFPMNLGVWPMTSPVMMPVATAPMPIQAMSPDSHHSACGSTDEASTSASEGSPKSITPLDGSEQRRTAQNQAEKQRRNILKSGFEELKVMVPECGNGQSKAKILHKAVDYVHELVREKASLFREVDKLRQEVQQLRGVLNQYEAMQGQEGEALPRPLPEAFRRERRDPADLMDVKFYVFCVVIDRLYESFCATVSMDNTSAFTTSLMKWFEVHCNAETFFKPLHSLGSRFITEDSARRLKTLGSAVSAGKNTVVNLLDASGRRGVPYAQQLGATIDYVGTMCYLEATPTSA